MKTFQEASQKFRALSARTGLSKVSSYNLDVSFNGADGTVSLHFGTYDVGDFPRHSNFGPFDNEAEALKFCEAFIGDCERELARVGE